MNRRDTLKRAGFSLAALGLGAGWAKTASAAETFEVTKTDAEWKAQLTPEQFHVTREHGTERAFSNPLNKEKRAGMFS